MELLEVCQICGRRKIIELSIARGRGFNWHFYELTEFFPNLEKYQDWEIWICDKCRSDNRLDDALNDELDYEKIAIILEHKRKIKPC